MSKFKNMSDDFLRDNYVPDVYQPDIYAIDYEKLKAAGIKFISFDIDGTIESIVDKPSKTAIVLFTNLKKMGFELGLITNNKDERGKIFAEALEVEYIPRAEKPKTVHFKTLQERHKLDKKEMAHVGNSMLNDVAGGNSFGITSCLVRSVGTAEKVGMVAQKVLGKTEGQLIREELKARDIWRKHHKHTDGDQYYQLGEAPGYRSTSE